MLCVFCMFSIVILDASSLMICYGLATECFMFQSKKIKCDKLQKSCSERIGNGLHFHILPVGKPVIRPQKRECALCAHPAFLFSFTVGTV